MAEHTHFRTAEGWRIDWRIRQRMAPAMRRILEYLEANPGRYSDAELSAACFCARGVAKGALNKLHAAGILRIAGYRRTGAIPQALYWFRTDDARDALPPAPLTNAQRQARRCEHLRIVFGHHAWRVHASRNSGGAETLVLDGKTVYRRRPKKP